MSKVKVNVVANPYVSQKALCKLCEVSGEIYRSIFKKVQHPLIAMALMSAIFCDVHGSLLNYATSEGKKEGGKRK